MLPCLNLGCQGESFVQCLEKGGLYRDLINIIIEYDERLSILKFINNGDTQYYIENFFEIGTNMAVCRGLGTWAKWIATIKEQSPWVSCIYKGIDNTLFNYKTFEEWNKMNKIDIRNPYKLRKNLMIVHKKKYDLFGNKEGSYYIWLEKMIKEKPHVCDFSLDIGDMNMFD
nr:hypothetical protein [Crucivirus sp.]